MASTILIRIAPEHHQRLKQIAAYRNCSLQELCLESLLATIVAAETVPVVCHDLKEYRLTLIHLPSRDRALITIRELFDLLREHAKQLDEGP